MTTSDKWVSIEDSAAHLGVARGPAHRWIEGRGLPAHQIGRLWEFKLSDVDEWVRAGGASDDEHQAARGSKARKS